MNLDVTKNHWDNDIRDMHTKYGVREAVKTFDAEKLKKFIQFRLDFLQEELDESKKALFDLNASNTDHVKAADDIVDAMIDLCVVAIGTLDALQVDAHSAWNRVLAANMNKEVGIKESRPNPLGLPDLIKPEGWVAPYHYDNIGLMRKI
jgi:predicted HAD superfamily Cof-like phosphohydrolase